MGTPSIPQGLQGPVADLVSDLRDVFDARLRAVVAYGPRLGPPGRAAGPPLNTLALVDAVAFTDLSRAVERAAAWDRAGLAMPLLLGRDEFVRSLDAFPFEYDDILSRHVVVYGADPLEGLSVDRLDLRRACEAAAKGHLIHLREGYLESRGRGVDLARLVAASAAPFAALLGRVARLRGVDVSDPEALGVTLEGIAGLSASVVSEIVARLDGTPTSSDEARRIFPAYLDVIQQLVAYVDGWVE